MRVGNRRRHHHLVVEAAGLIEKAVLMVVVDECLHQGNPDRLVAEGDAFGLLIGASPKLKQATIETHY